MLFVDIVQKQVLAFGKEYMMEYNHIQETNIYHVITLHKQSVHIVFRIEEMELYLNVAMKFFDANGELVKEKILSDSTNTQIAKLRKAALRSWWKRQQDRLLLNMINEFIGIIRCEITQFD